MIVIKVGGEDCPVIDVAFIENSGFRAYIFLYKGNIQYLNCGVLDKYLGGNALYLDESFQKESYIVKQEIKNGKIVYRR